MSPWLLFAALAPFCWGTANVLDSAVRRRFIKNDYAMVWIFGMARLVFIVPILLFMGDLQAVAKTDLFFMLLAGFLWLVPFVFYYKAIEFEELSRVVILLQMLPLCIPLVAYVVIGETLNPMQWIAFAFLLSGGVLASVKAIGGKFRLSRALPMMFFACILWALSDVLFKKYAGAFGTFWNAFLWYLAGGLVFSVPFFFVRKGREFIQKHFSNLPRRVWWFFGFDLLIGMSGSLAMTYALTMGTVSLTAVLMGIQPLIAFGMSFLLRPFIPEIEPEDTATGVLVKKGLSLALIITGLFFLV